MNPLALYVDPDAGFRIFDPSQESDWLQEQEENDVSTL